MDFCYWFLDWPSSGKNGSDIRLLWWVVIMIPEIENALRSVARACRSEIVSEVSGKPKKDHDAITTEILNRHAKKITAVPPGRFSAKLWLSYFVHQIDKELKI